MSKDAADLWAEEICKLADEFAQIPINFDSPFFDFQQSMIANVKRYRKARENQVTTCEHSGISFNRKGEVVEPETEGHICMTKDLHGIDAL